jgi:iron complex transport system substrate-binding protein
MHASTAIRRLIVAGLAAAMLSPAVPRAEVGPRKPQRIVSINLCLDEIVLRVAEARNIAAVTWLSRDADISNVVPLAKRVPINHGLSEEIVPLQPDLVLAGLYTTRPTVSILKRIGIRTLDFDVPRSFEEARKQYRDVAAILGESDNGERVVAEIDSRLAKLPTGPWPLRPRAIVLNPNGYTVGRGSIVDEIITRAGLTNVAVEMGIGEYGQIPLETAVMNSVDVMIVSASRDGPPGLATDLLRHPALAKLSGRTRVVVMPNRLWACSGPELVEAIERLARAAHDVRDGNAKP